ncbi:MAG: GntR family transcriptional regulator [Burkholderiaceae bacterium]
MLLSPSPLRSLLLAMVRPQGESHGETLSLAEQITLQLAAEIVEGQIPVSTRLTEVAVAQRFKVSRGPVREALRMLDSTGLVQWLPRRGALVTELSSDEVADLFDLRAVLFGLGARRFALRRQQADLIALRAHLTQLQLLGARNDDGATGDYALAVLECGSAICVAAGIERLTTVVTGLFFRTLRYSRLGLATAERRRQSVANWSALVAQIEAGEGELAEATARRLVEASRDEAIRALANREG